MATWTPNDKQKAFLEALSKTADGKGLTLREVSKQVGFEVKSGTINALIKKGLVQTEDIEVACEIVTVDTHEVIGTCKKTFKAYSLVKGK